MRDANTQARLREAKRTIKLILSKEKKDRDRGLKAARERKRHAFGRGRVKDPDYLRWIRRRPCLACGKAAPSQAAHIRSGYPEAGWRPTGMQEKPDDRRTVPLCSACHLDGPNAQHKRNEREWWEGLGLYPPDICAALVAEYEKGGQPED